MRVKAFLERVRKGRRLIEMMHVDQDTLRTVYGREGSKFDVSEFNFTLLERVNP